VRRVAMAFLSLLFLLLLFSVEGCKAQKTPPTSATAPQRQEVSVGSGLLAQFEKELTELVERVSPSVVAIYSTQEVSRGFGEDFPFFFPFQVPQERRSLGSGVIIALKNGKFYILTNNHVVQGSKRIRVRFDPHTEKDGRLVGGDPKTDVAVVEVDAKGIENPEGRVAKLGDSDKLKVGQLVIAIGNPYGLERTVTFGVISALRRSIGITQYESFIQTDAPINPGNSGGPLINIRGEVIGINTAIVAEGQGLGFAIPINLAKWVADQLMAKGRVVRGWLGVVIQEITPEIAETIGVKEGILVAQVAPGSPAEKAGLKVGDIIVAVDGEKVREVRELQFRIMKTPPGTEITLTIIRGGKEQTIKAKVGEMPEEVSFGQPQEQVGELGLSLRDLSPEEVRRFGVKGVFVDGVAPGSLAQRSGLRRGDIILAVNNEPVESLSQFNEKIEKARSEQRTRVLLLIRRGGNNLYVVLYLR
jgi:periplasmic serine protease, Do/DeqQ family